MIWLILALTIAAQFIVLLVFLLGFRLGGTTQVSELQRVQTEAAVARRELHDVTRSAFIAMADEVERQQRRQP